VNQIDQICLNTLRFLAVDAVEKAKSGHPGLPLGAAPMAYVLKMTRMENMRWSPTKKGQFLNQPKIR